jgi:hypothetical protein
MAKWRAEVEEGLLSEALDHLLFEDGRFLNLFCRTYKSTRIEDLQNLARICNLISERRVSQGSFSFACHGPRRADLWRTILYAKRICKAVLESLANHRSASVVNARH